MDSSNGKADHLRSTKEQSSPGWIRRGTSREKETGIGGGIRTGFRDLLKMGFEVFLGSFELRHQERLFQKIKQREVKKSWESSSWNGQQSSDYLRTNAK